MNEECLYIYSDGACDNKWVGKGTEKGGWAVIVKYNGRESVFTGSEQPTTNNRMEVAGIAECLPRILKQGVKNIEIISDSKYLLMGVNAASYRKRLKNNKLINADLWKPIFEAMDEHKPKIKTTWVKGHNGHPENERCNELAEQISKSVENKA